MTKSEGLIEKASPEQEAEYYAMEYENRSTYAMAMLNLQEKAGLTYKEARAYLIPYRETTHSLSWDFEVDLHAIYNLQRKAKKKITNSGMTFEEICEGHVPEDLGLILVNPYRGLDWKGWGKKQK